jgi:ABC-type multidrug transport system ATPase subunit
VLKGLTRRRERTEIVDAMLQRCNLYEVRKKALTGFSGGMRQRFGIAQALIGNPQLLIVDEPTAGLDPEERNRFYNLLAEVGEQVIVILSTHIVGDAWDMCARMAILNKGRILYEGSPEAAVRELKGRIWQTSVCRADLPAYQQQYRIISSKLVGGRSCLHVYDEHPPAPGERFEAAAPDLEDVFFYKIRDSRA